MYPVEVVFRLLKYMITSKNISSMCVQLDMFSGVSLQEPIEVLTESEFQEMAQRQGIAEEVIYSGPCRKCPQNYLCDGDICSYQALEFEQAYPYWMSDAECFQRDLKYAGINDLMEL